MNKKKIIITAAAVMFSIIGAATAYAGQWHQDSKGWWYSYDNGGYAAGKWEQIAGKYYYFDQSGYMLANTTTPDGYKVGADGAWIQNTNDAQNSGLSRSAVVGEWEIDPDEFRRRNQISVINAYGHYNFDDYLLLRGDGTMKIKMGAFWGGNGTYSIENDRVVLDYMEYEEGHQKEYLTVSLGSGRDQLLMYDNPYFVPWVRK